MEAVQSASLEQWGTLSLAILAYVTVWTVSIDARARSPLTQSHTASFLFGAFVIVVGAAVGLLSTGSLQAAAYGAIGAGALYLSLVLYHPSTNILVHGAACVATIGFELNWSIVDQPWLVLFPTGLFMCAYLICHPRFVALFGSGATTLFSLIAAALFAILYGLELLSTLLPPSMLGRLALGAVPLVLMLTGHPDYLVARPLRRYLLLTGVAGAVTIVAWAQHPYSGSLLTAAITTALLAVSLLSTVAKGSTPLGPFYSFERRATVLQMLCVVLVSLEVAAHESHDPRVSAALLHLHLGYATAVAVLAVVSKGCQLVSAASAEDYRWGWLAVLSLISVLLGAVFAVDQLFPTTSHAHVRALAPFGLWLQKVPLPFGFASWEGAWHVALASGAVFVVSTFCLRNLTRSTPLLAPLVSDVTVRFVSSTPKVALTFNGSIEGEHMAPLLQLLDAVGVHATFFIPRDSSLAQKKMCAAVVERGHEIGCLGLAGPHFTSEIIGDIAATKQALESTLHRPIQWYRPQDASRDVCVLRAANAAGLHVALWSVCPFDWDATPQTIRSRIHAQCSGDVRGVIVSLNLSVPAYLAAPAAAQRPPHDVLMATRESINAIREIAHNATFHTLSSF